MESTFKGGYFNNSLTGESHKVDEYSTPSKQSSLFPISNDTSSHNTDIPNKITDETPVIYSSNEPSSIEKNNLFFMDTADSGKRIKNELIFSEILDFKIFYNFSSDIVIFTNFGFFHNLNSAYFFYEKSSNFKFILIIKIIFLIS